MAGGTGVEGLERGHGAEGYSFVVGAVMNIEAREGMPDMAMPDEPPVPETVPADEEPSSEDDS